MSLISQHLEPLPLDPQPDQRLYVVASYLQGIAAAFGFARTGLEETP
jgi:hypothetical protein